MLPSITYVYDECRGRVYREGDDEHDVPADDIYDDREEVPCSASSHSSCQRSPPPR